MTTVVMEASMVAMLVTMFPMFKDFVGVFLRTYIINYLLKYTNRKQMNIGTC